MKLKKHNLWKKKFELEINGKIILNGMIDKICLEDGLLEVVDYKTTKNKKYLVNDFMQLLTYAFILWNEDKSIKKVKGTYSLIRHNFEKVSRIFDVEEIIEISKKYEEYGLKIRTDKTFIAKPTVLCSWCEYLEFCDEGKMKVAPKIVVGEIAWGKKK